MVRQRQIVCSSMRIAQAAAAVITPLKFGPTFKEVDTFALLLACDYITKVAA